MSDEKSTVWIATPIRHLPPKTPVEAKDFPKLAKGYANPISLLAHAETLPWTVEMAVMGGAHLCAIRNRIATRFLESAAKFLFFSDYDIRPEWNDYARILARNLPICGGLYTTKEENPRWVMNRLPNAVPTEDGLLPVMELGGGFKCYHREALIRIAEKFPGISYRADDTGKDEWAFFSMGPIRDEKCWPGFARFLTEDYWLDWLARESGIPIVADTTVRVRHYDEKTTKIFPAEWPADPTAMPAETAEP